MNIFSTFLLGHRRIVAVLGANHLDGVQRNLEMLEARFLQVLEDEGHHGGPTSLAFNGASGTP